MPIVQAIFIISLTNNNANNNNTVNEYQNRWLIIKIEYVFKSNVWKRYEMKWWAATATINEWTNDNMSNNTYQ